jgi:hypothetical protein
MGPKKVLWGYETVKVASSTPDSLILEVDEERRKKEGIEGIMVKPWCSELGASTGLDYRPLIDRKQLIGKEAKLLDVMIDEMEMEVQGLGKIRVFTCASDEPIPWLCFERIERE